MDPWLLPVAFSEVGHEVRLNGGCECRSRLLWGWGVVAVFTVLPGLDQDWSGQVLGRARVVSEPRGLSTEWERRSSSLGPLALAP